MKSSYFSEDEDQNGLRGLSYNHTQPPLDDPHLFSGFNIALLASHCFEEVELTYPWIYFTNRSAKVDIITPSWVPGKIAACEYARATLWGNFYLFIKIEAKSSFSFGEALHIKYDAIIIIGGVWSSTVVRNDPDAISLIRTQYSSGRIVAAVCSGTTALINAGLTTGLNMTGSPSIQIDLINSGATYHDVPTVTQGTIVTGRSPQHNDSLEFVEAVASALLGLKRR
jgi:protease I